MNRGPAYRYFWYFFYSLSSQRYWLIIFHQKYCLRPSQCWTPVDDEITYLFLFIKPSLGAWLRLYFSNLVLLHPFLFQFRSAVPLLSMQLISQLTIRWQSGQSSWRLTHFSSQLYRPPFLHMLRCCSFFWSPPADGRIKHLPPDSLFYWLAS